MSGRARFVNSKKDGQSKPSWRDRHQAAAPQTTQQTSSSQRHSRDADSSYSAGASYTQESRSYSSQDQRGTAPAGNGGGGRFESSGGGRFERETSKRDDQGSDSRFSRGDNPDAFYDRRDGGYGRRNPQRGGDYDRRGGYGGGGDPDVKKSFYKESPSIAAMTEDEVTAWRKLHEMIVEGADIPRPLKTFEDAGFPDATLKQLNCAGFPNPTPIQSQAWPMALSGKDVIGIAQTGSGKTLSFLLPGVVHIMAQPPLRRGDGPIGLVLAPTRELANQINEECARFNAGLRVTCVYGGAPKWDQKRDLQRGVEIVIATPGRLMDFMDSRDICMRRITYLVMDEADRMLDMGFEPQIRSILEKIRPDRQTLMFSATWPKGVERLAKDYMSGEVIKVTIGSTELTSNKRITQRVEIIEGLRNKEDRLFEILSDEVQDQKVLIFAGTKRMCNDLERILTNCNVYCSAIHGDKNQTEREAALHDFKVGHTQIMIGTDVAARGIHVDDIQWVINYDFPQQVEDYIHRIGRTARAGRTGNSITFMTRKDSRHADTLIEILTEANQQVPEALRRLAFNSGPPRRYGGRSGGGDRAAPSRSGGFGNFGGGGGGGGFGNRTNGYAPSGGSRDIRVPASKPTSEPIKKKKVDRSAW